MSDINDFDVTNDFKLSEFQSPDTGEVKIHPKLLQLLQAVRNEVGQPIIINSGYRTPEHNEEVGGADQSQHMKGTAADISLDNLNLGANGLAEIAKEQAEKVGIGADNLGIGKYHSFLHLDTRGLIGAEAPARWDKR